MSAAADLLAKADKKAGSSGGFSFFSSGTSKYEEAHDLYQGAANGFKLEKRWKESGDAFCKAAEMSIKADERDDAANDFWNAAKSYKKAQPALAVAALKKTIEILVTKGRFRQAADREKEIGQIFQQDAGDLPSALDAYEQAGEWYSAEDATATANACFKDVADIAAQLQQYPKAIERFEQVASASLQSPLTRYSSKEYFLKAGLCHLCTGDTVAARRAFEHYVQQDGTFASTREHKFLVDIANAVEAEDQAAFTQHVADYDQLTKLDDWKTTVLLAIRRSIAEEPGLT
ncbi:uncharacterized protein L969DRAFT_72967 [Mixia osmundae IAM 14324]|uniref:Vesicular-fusion protein SEC17 n=1 Tax=Mixia osmundae (strain CBS 9802 / IAM 14324 / JCM 22182 / KY 12970) TaxID=764103 RepID=G7E989_MIXOS|nr:uncharacterized protein L969DRAFT_72967 [Mixia osmundae IAM 14324]KEI39831.1 hypothetical protein L969DRAFT_72967 [Mixia osmundae IAM 14324]GAA99208.1 hypothetical protein E5Q_05901 [Mixia osmundae IAM 14324]